MPSADVQIWSPILRDVCFMAHPLNHYSFYYKLWHAMRVKIIPLSLYNSRSSSGVSLRAHFRMMMRLNLCLSEMNSVACHGPEVVSPSVNKVQKVSKDNDK